MHTKDILAEALRTAGLTSMAEKAATGYYHDFLSPLDTPSIQLADDLSTYANAPSWPRKEEAKALLDRHLNGEFDASQEESEAWAGSDDGKETFSKLIPGRSGKPPAGKEQMGRLAMREEGPFWNAYYAMPGTMDGAILLGSILMRFVEHKERKRAFMALMQEAVSDLIEEVFGQRPAWPEGPQSAPENERRV